MNMPIQLEVQNELHLASLLGAPQIRGAGRSRDEAITQLQRQVEDRVQRGELGSIEVRAKRGVSRLSGKYADDPFLNDICDAAYRERDADRDAMAP